MTDEANSVVECLGGREGLVATFMGHDPQTGTKASLDESIEGPANSTDSHRRNVGRSPEGMKEGEGGSKGDDIPGNVHQASGRRALKTMLGDRSADVVDGEFWDLEFIAVGIDQFAILRFRLDQLARQFCIDQVA